MIRITLRSPGDVRHRQATELRPCFKYVSAAAQAGAIAGHGMHSFNFIALSAFIKTHLSQREREKMRRREKK